LIHPDWMSGRVEVAPASVTNLPDQAEIDATAQQEVALLMTRLERARGQGAVSSSKPGPNTAGYSATRE
jgi:hypothetical protein